ncbi:histidine--tRNA ligase [Nemorincola caseinilytica]|uniref:Histidine--tRNA ligase n=1 Tax=Nemorincola caseinilytica TaxID=2054315 RepID=A0ABP8NSY0_9BACT
MKPSIPQGTRDLSPEVVRKRQYIFGTLRSIFELYGFQPLETPAMENLTTLTGKYGEEGDRLIFKILNNGLHEKSEADKNKLNAEWNNVLSRSYSSPVVTERALRYDLTIPFARYVVMHHHELALPFRRYQMQPVWRADRPQKGRYREFWQCDADVVGSTSLINEAELLCIYGQAFSRLAIPVAIKVNSRKLLQGLSEICGHPDKMTDITVALDKLDKIGWSGVANELQARGIDADGVARLEQVIQVFGTNSEKLQALVQIMATSEAGMQGITEITDTLSYYAQLADHNMAGDAQIVVDVSLARGLNYYTGIIVEVVCTHPDVKMGSIGGGGRYDDLTGLFGLKGLSGVGVSFGIDRIYDVLEELALFPQQLSAATKAIILNFGGENERYALDILRRCREAGIAAEIYPDAAKFDKQMKYANKRGIQYVLLPGDDERAAGRISVKNFTTGEQTLLDVADAISLLQQASATL